MLYVFIGAFVTLALLIGLVTVAAALLANEVRGQIRRRTAELVTLYDGVEKERGETAPEPARPPAIARPPAAAPGAGAFASQAASSALHETEQISSAHYLNKELPVLYREVRSQFYINPAQALASLPIADAPRDGGPATRLLARLGYETAFALSGLPGSEQHRLLCEVLDGDGLRLLEEYEKTGDRFDMLDFCGFLRLKSSGEARPVTVYVPSDMLNYRTFAENVEVVADADICDGIQIEADNVIYDFAIKGREIS
ncbi:MAG: hypothetical protein LBK23_08580 [Oscillospiraceae bacterium]|jgi:hypothetical protein|nr:hypothetical protein [Oscillospiraceae bacterium]